MHGKGAEHEPALCAVNVARIGTGNEVTSSKQENSYKIKLLIQIGLEANTIVNILE
jgi:hypothetical protein